MDALKDASDRKCWSVLVPVTANMLRVRNGWTLLLTDGPRRGRLEHGGSVRCAHYSLAAKASRSSLRWVTTTKLTGFDPQTYLADVLERTVSGRAKSHQLHDLLGWKAARKKQTALGFAWLGFTLFKSASAIKPRRLRPVSISGSPQGVIQQ
jgi:hypothetical protein